MCFRCNEKPDESGFYHCGNGRFVDGIRCCSEYGLKVQIDYCGHYFCACLGEQFDESQCVIDFGGCYE